MPRIRRTVKKATWESEGKQVWKGGLHMVGNRREKHPGSEGSKAQI